MTTNRQTGLAAKRSATTTDALYPAIFTAVIAFLVYLFTLEPDLTWANFGGDGGELITAAVTFGIPHPPGYPTYVLIGNLFSRLPIGTTAFRFNLLSALGTAVAAGFITGIVFWLHPLINDRAGQMRPMNKARNFRGMAVAVSAGLCFAFGSLVWGQAIIAEVYGLNLAFIAAFLYLLIASKKFAISGLFFGLSITTHLTSAILLPFALLLAPRQKWPRLMGGALVGLLPILILPLLAQSNSPLIWGQPNTLGSWWWLVSAQLYRPNLFGLALADWPERFREWSGPFLAQFAYAGWLLMVVGFYGRFKTNARILSGLLVTALFYIFYAFSYNTNDAAVLLLPALLLLSIVLGFGLNYLGKAAIILPIALLWLNLGQLADGYYVNTITTVRPAIEELLEDIPAEAILLTSGDPTIAALWYFHHVEGMRPDIIVIDGNLFQFDWYRAQLGRDYPNLQHLAQDDLPGFKEINSQSRPFCEASITQPGYLRC